IRRRHDGGRNHAGLSWISDRRASISTRPSDDAERPGGSATSVGGHRGAVRRRGARRNSATASQLGFRGRIPSGNGSSGLVLSRRGRTNREKTDDDSSAEYGSRHLSDAIGPQAVAHAAAIGEFPAAGG